MIEGYIDEVMIKVISNLQPDKVIIVRNLPAKFLYEKQPKMVSKRDRDGYVIDALVPSPDGATEKCLKEGLELSRNGDGSIVFNVSRQTAKSILAEIDAYIQGTLPRDIVVPQRVEYSSQRGNMLASPIARFQIPAIDLPKPEVKPELNRAVEEASPPAKAEPLKRTRVLTPEQKAKRCEILAKARAARSAKLAQK
jgi:hypothetical protein